MSPHVNPVSATPSSFPRVSGDEPTRHTRVMTITWFSPRERG